MNVLGLNGKNILALFLTISLAFTLLGIPAALAQEEDQFISWDKNRPLTWDDFKGEPDASSPHSAETVTKLESAWEGEGVKGGVKVTSVSSTAFFNSSQSWVKEGQKSDDLLKHEQGHFDIAEIFAREKKKEMDKLVGQVFESEEAVNKKVEEICQKIQKRLDKMNEQYDKQTKHGTDKKKQEQWDKKIKKILEGK